MKSGTCENEGGESFEFKTNLHMECPEKYANFFNMFFVIMTTISIIGYTQPSDSQPGRISFIFLMFIIVIVVPN